MHCHCFFYSWMVSFFVGFCLTGQSEMSYCPGDQHIRYQVSNTGRAGRPGGEAPEPLRPPSNFTEQIAIALVRLQSDLEIVAQRLDTLEKNSQKDKVVRELFILVTFHIKCDRQVLGIFLQQFLNILHLFFGKVISGRAAIMCGGGYCCHFYKYHWKIFWFKCCKKPY